MAKHPKGKQKNMKTTQQQNKELSSKRITKIMQEIDAELKTRGINDRILNATSSNRDTQGWAIKCSSITLEYDDGITKDGEGGTYLENRDVYKDPITDRKKKSAKGRVTLWYNHAAKEFFTEAENFKFDGFPVTEMLNTVYENGVLTKRWSLDDLRNASRTDTQEVA